MPLIRKTKLVTGDHIVYCDFPMTIYKGGFATAGVGLVLGEVEVSRKNHYYAHLEYCFTCDLLNSIPFNCSVGECMGRRHLNPKEAERAPVLMGTVCGKPPETKYEANRFFRALVKKHHKFLVDKFMDEWYVVRR